MPVIVRIIHGLLVLTVVVDAYQAAYGISVVVKDKVHVHDLHATILHLLGLNHERLIYRHAGRGYRLTDVAGRVVTEILT